MMTRWFLSIFAVLAIAAAVALAVARPGALSHDGTFAQPVAAFADTEPSATPWAYIDKVLNNGDGPCDPNAIDSTTTEYTGDSHRLALCVANLPAPVQSFTAAITYAGALDQCIDKQCHVLDGLESLGTEIDDGCLDDNPDANAGDTTFGENILGEEGWTCSGVLAGAEYQMQPFLSDEPTCDLPRVVVAAPTENTAWIRCHGDGDYDLGGEGEWGALAVLDLNVIGAGVDNVAIASLSISTGTGPLLECSGLDINADSIIDIPCQGATDIKREHKRPTFTPTPAPTATPRPPTATPPPPTPTPLGGAGPLIVPPPTGSGPRGSSSPWILWLAIGVAGAAATAGGLYLRRAAR